MRVLTKLPNLCKGLSLLLFICFCNSYVKGQVVISNCPVQEGTYADQAAQDAAADGTVANPFATWFGALTFAQTNNINTITFGEGTYQTDNSVFNAFGIAGGHAVTLDGMTINGNNATIVGNGISVGFASIETDNVSLNDLNLTAFAGALVIEDVLNFNYTNGVIDSSDMNGVNGVFINSDAVSTDATFTNVQFNNHGTPNFTSAMDIFASSANPAINTTVTFNNTSWSCNERNGFGGALFIGHGGGRGGGDPGPIVTFNGGGFYDNIGTANAGDGGAMNVQDNAVLVIDGTEFVCNTSEAADGTSGGGALRIQGGAFVSISNANFSNNNTFQYGGAILFTVANGADPALTITNTVFWNNAANRGGGLYTGSETTTTITGSYFEGNTSSSTHSMNNGGGGIYIDAGPNNVVTLTQTVLNLINSTLTGNTGNNNNGGGMHIQEAETTSDDPPGSGTEDIITITNSVICGNNNSDDNTTEDLTEDANEPFLTTGFSSVIIDINSVIGEGMADAGVTNVPDRNLSQGDCAAIPALVGYQGVPPGALVCPACPTIAMPANLCPVCITCDVYPWSGDN